MIRRLCLLLVASAFVFGCKGKEKTPEASTDTGGQTTEAVGTEPLPPVATGDSDSGTIAGLRSINFDYDKAVLGPQAKEILAGNAQWLKSNGSAKLEVEGHSDSRGTNEYNLALGERRANTVKNYLVSLGIPDDRLSVVSYGEEKPLKSGESDADYAANRRANFVPR